MGNPDPAKPTEQPVLSDADVERIVDALDRRMLSRTYPVPVPAPEVSPRLVEPDDLIGPKDAAYLAGRHEKTIQRWQNDHDISVVVVGTKFISRRKLLAYLARRQDADDDGA
jgi:hypothetical protein